MRRFEKARARLDATIYGLIRERRESGADTGDLLSMLLLAQDEEKHSGGMTDKQVRDEALTLFLAGHETGANALTWTWYLLSQHPEVERRLHEEIDAVLGDRAPELADVPQLRYAEMILVEALRLYPPAWAIGRKALEAFTIGRLRDSRQFHLHREPIRGAARRPLVSRAREVRSRALGTGSWRIAPQVFLFPVWRRRPRLHRRTLRLDGGRDRDGGDRSKMAVPPGARPARGAAAADHFAREEWTANGR